MRRITFALMSTIAAVVLLFSYRTSTNSTAAGSTSAGSTPAGVVTPQGGDTGTSNSGGTGKSANTVVNGSTAQTRWGPVQVQVTIASGRITDISVLQQPESNRRDQEINSYALPQLHDQAIAAQSAQLDGVTGATVTSEGYKTSLQAALDAAHLG